MENMDEKMKEIYSTISKMSFEGLSELLKFVNDLTDAEYCRRKKDTWDNMKKAIDEYENTYGSLELYDPDSNRYYEIAPMTDTPSPISIYES